MKVALIAIAVAGCASNPGSDPAGDDTQDVDVEAPVLCPASQTLAPESPGLPASVTVGPLDLGTASLCLHLDTRTLTRGHFMAGTSLREPGTASSFVLTLADPDGTKLVDGWDVSFGSEDPQVFANLEMAMDAGVERDVVLTVAAKGAGARRRTSASRYSIRSSSYSR